MRLHQHLLLAYTFGFGGRVKVFRHLNPHASVNVAGIFVLQGCNLAFSLRYRHLLHPTDQVLDGRG